MKLGPLAKLQKQSSKKFDDDDILANYDVILTSLIYCQSKVIRQPKS